MLLSCVPRFWPTPLVSKLAWGEDESKRNNKYDLSDGFSSVDQKAHTYLPEGYLGQGMGRRQFISVLVTAKHRICVLLLGQTQHVPQCSVFPKSLNGKSIGLEMSAFVLSLSPLLAGGTANRVCLLWGLQREDRW